VRKGRGKSKRPERAQAEKVKKMDVWLSLMNGIIRSRHLRGFVMRLA
jgi:hypothetical protein